MPQQEISSNEMHGISKKISNELESLPIHTHLAIVEMVKVSADHRNFVMKAAHNQQQRDQEERIIRLKEQEMERYQEQQRERAKKAPTLVESPPPN